MGILDIYDMHRIIFNLDMFSNNCILCWAIFTNNHSNEMKFLNPALDLCTNFYFSNTDLSSVSQINHLSKHKDLDVRNCIVWDKGNLTLQTVCLLRRENDEWLMQRCKIKRNPRKKLLFSSHRIWQSASIQCQKYDF